MTLAGKIFNDKVCGRCMTPNERLDVYTELEETAWKAWWDRANLFYAVKKKKERALFEVFWNTEITIKDRLYASNRNDRPRRER